MLGSTDVPTQKRNPEVPLCSGRMEVPGLRHYVGLKTTGWSHQHPGKFYIFAMWLGLQLMRHVSGPEVTFTDPFLLAKIRTRTQLDAGHIKSKISP